MTFGWHALPPQARVPPSSLFGDGIEAMSSSTPNEFGIATRYPT